MTIFLGSISNSFQQNLCWLHWQNVLPSKGDLFAFPTLFRGTLSHCHPQVFFLCLLQSKFISISVQKNNELYCWFYLFFFFLLQQLAWFQKERNYNFHFLIVEGTVFKLFFIFHHSSNHDQLMPFRPRCFKIQVGCADM